jgi:nucleotide-binding universal stress UspA family protein
MYKHILVPTDGSELSRSAVEAALALAKAVGARVTGVHVVPSKPLSSLEAWVHGNKETSAQLAAIQKENARRYLAEIAVRGHAVGVPCQCRQVAGDQVYEEIVRLARARRCDLIYMASHGRRGTADVILGSETVKVLTHSPLPVLVHRPPVTLRISPRGAAGRHRRRN